MAGRDPAIQDRPSKGCPWMSRRICGACVPHDCGHDVTLQYRFCLSRCRGFAGGVGLIVLIALSLASELFQLAALGMILERFLDWVLM